MTRLTAANAYKNSILKIFPAKIPNLLRYRGSIILIFSLGLLLVNATFLFESSNRWVYWLYDDTEHLSIAYNVFHGKGLTRDFIDYGANSKEHNIPNLMMYDQISNPLKSKPPLHLLLLGGWLLITGANYTNWFFWGSIFNFILAALSIVVFYFFTKRHFGIQIASYATPVLALMPPLIWFSVRIRPDLLAFIFIMMSFYFAARRMTSQNVILVGLFCGLSHISHPIGLLPGSALVIYLLLFKRKFKATIILLGTWGLIILPWMVRNYVIFGDSTQGLGLPIPRGISTTLGLISSGTPLLNSAELGTITGIPLSQTMLGMLDEFTNLYGMQFFMVFVACSIFAYLSFAAIKRAVSSSYTRIFLILSVILYVRAVTWATSFNNLVLQFSMFFLIPLSVFLVIRFFSHHKDIFTTDGNEIYTILAIFVIINFVVYLMFAQTTGRVVPEVRVVIFSLFVFIPLSIIGIKKLLEAICAFLVRSSSMRNKCISFSMFSILFLFSFTQILTGIPSINALHDQFAETEDMRNMNKWIIENVPSDSKIASSHPHAILLRTGHEAVNFATAFIDNVAYEEWILKKFDIDYLVFYGSGAYKPPILNTTDLGNMELRLVYRAEGGQVYRTIEK